MSCGTNARRLFDLIARTPARSKLIPRRAMARMVCVRNDFRMVASAGRVHTLRTHTFMYILRARCWAWRPWPNCLSRDHAHVMCSVCAMCVEMVSSTMRVRKRAARCGNIIIKKRFEWFCECRARSRKDRWRGSNYSNVHAADCRSVRVHIKPCVRPSTTDERNQPKK